MATSSPKLFRLVPTKEFEAFFSRKRNIPSDWEVGRSGEPTVFYYDDKLIDSPTGPQIRALWNNGREWLAAVFFVGIRADAILVAPPSLVPKPVAVNQSVQANVDPAHAEPEKKGKKGKAADTIISLEPRAKTEQKNPAPAGAPA